MCLKSSTQNLLKYINKFVVVCTRTCHHSIGLSMTCQHFDDNRSIGYYIVSSVHKMKLLENHVFFLLAYNIVACQVHKFEDFEIEISFCESWEKLWTMSQVITYDIGWNPSRNKKKLLKLFWHPLAIECFVSRQGTYGVKPFFLHVDEKLVSKYVHVQCNVS